MVCVGKRNMNSLCLVNAPKFHQESSRGVMQFKKKKSKHTSNCASANTTIRKLSQMRDIFEKTWQKVFL